MKLQHALFPLLSLFAFTLSQAEIILSYKFRTHEAKKLFDSQNGEEYVHKAINVSKCGTGHLKGNASANKVVYENCIKKLKFPAEFESEVLALKPADFASPAIFEDVYNRKLFDYAVKIDGMYSGPAKPINLEFSMNLLALLLVPAAFVIIYFVNKPKTVAADDGSKV